MQTYLNQTMNKHEKKLIKFQNKAQDCASREEAQEILRKAEKARCKLLAKKLLEDTNSEATATKDIYL